MVMDRATVLDRTRRYIQENLLYTRPDFELTDATSLISIGVIDSMGVLELVEFVEEEFGIRVGDDEITEENLDSLAAITTYVLRKSAS